MHDCPTAIPRIATAGWDCTCLEVSWTAATSSGLLGCHWLTTGCMCLHLTSIWKPSCTEVTAAGMSQACMTAQLPCPDLLLMSLGIAAGCMQLRWLADLSLSDHWL
jgi:hypothetical protein